MAIKLIRDDIRLLRDGLGAIERRLGPLEESRLHQQWYEAGASFLWRVFVGVCKFVGWVVVVLVGWGSTHWDDLRNAWHAWTSAKE